jgi:hypothetical protein
MNICGRLCYEHVWKVRLGLLKAINIDLYDLYVADIYE